MKTTREEREQWAARINQSGPLRSPVGLNWSSVARLVDDVDGLENALDLLAEHVEIGRAQLRTKYPGSKWFIFDTIQARAALEQETS